MQITAICIDKWFDWHDPHWTDPIIHKMQIISKYCKWWVWKLSEVKINLFQCSWTVRKWYWQSRYQSLLIVNYSTSPRQWINLFGTVSCMVILSYPRLNLIPVWIRIFTQYRECDYLSMLGLKLNHVSGPPGLHLINRLPIVVSSVTKKPTHWIVTTKLARLPCDTA